MFYRTFILIMALSLMSLGCDIKSLTGDLGDDSVAESPGDGGGSPSVESFSLSYNKSSLVTPQSEAMGALSITTTASSVSGFTVTPSLPTGMTLNSSTGEISGTPSVVVDPAQTYTVKAMSGATELETTVSIRVIPGAVVNSTGNGGDSNTADGVCDDGGGNCTLRAAIEQFNVSAGEQVIYLPEGVVNITGSDLPDITTEITIEGEDRETTFIDGGGSFKAFIVNTSGHLKLSNVSIQNNFTSTGNGGGVYVASGRITLSDCHFENNTASGGFNGGGIAVISAGPNTVTNCTFTGNVADGRGGAIWVDGASADLDIVDTYVYKNSTTGLNSGSDDAGGIRFGDGATGTITTSTISENTCGDDGAGLRVDNGGNVTVVGTTIYGNVAADDAGGILNDNSTIVISHSTIIGNRSVGQGAGLRTGTNGTSNIGTSIIADNLSGGSLNNCHEVGAGDNISDGYNLTDDIADASCSMSVGNNDISGEPEVELGAPKWNGGPVPTLALHLESKAIDQLTAGQCPTLDARDFTRVAHTLATQSGSGVCDIGAYELQNGLAPTNLTYERTLIMWPVGVAMSPVTPKVTGTVDEFSVTPPLPIGMELNKTSGVISGTPASVTPSATNHTVTASNEFGAATVQFSVYTSAAYIVNSTADLGASGSNSDDTCDNGVAAPNDCSLRAALEEANNTSGDQMVYVPDGTYTLGGTALSLDSTSSDAIYLIGQSRNGVVIDGNAASQVFDIRDDFNIQNMTITNGRSTSAHGGNIFTVNSIDGYIGQVNITDGDATTWDAGGLYLNQLGNITIEFTLLKDNVADDEGAIWQRGSNVTYESVIFDNNDATTTTGALGVNTNGTAVIRNSLFINNDNVDGAGAIRMSTSSSGSFVDIYNSTFWNNTGTASGASAGGIQVINSTSHVLNLYNVTIAGNTSGSGSTGGGLEVVSGTANVYNSLIVDNTSGGGTYHNCRLAGGTFTHSGSIETDNDCGFTTNGSQELTSGAVNLQPLADNGGYTQTMALPVGSAAIDAGRDTNCLGMDARGIARARDGDGDDAAVCDVGAFEF